MLCESHLNKIVINTHRCTHLHTHLHTHSIWPAGAFWQQRRKLLLACQPGAADRNCGGSRRSGLMDMRWESSKKGKTVNTTAILKIENPRLVQHMGRTSVTHCSFYNRLCHIFMRVTAFLWSGLIDTCESCIWSTSDNLQNVFSLVNLLIFKTSSTSSFLF